MTEEESNTTGEVVEEVGSNETEGMEVGAGGNVEVEAEEFELLLLLLFEFESEFEKE